jgi:hypothetical protein
MVTEPSVSEFMHTTKSIKSMHKRNYNRMTKLIFSLFLLAIASVGAVGQINHQSEISIGMSVSTLYLVLGLGWL